MTYIQLGSGNYNAAAQVTQTVAAEKAGQTITFNALAAKKYGAPDFRISANASSGLPVTFAAIGKCTIAGTSVHLTGSGFCTLTASQPGDSNYSGANEVSRSLQISRPAPPACKVPRVIGKPLAAAKSSIKQRHCRTGKVAYAHS